MSWQPPKTNWISTDIYNFEDINRVESNLEYIENYLTSIGYSAPQLSHRKNRLNTDYDTVSDIIRIESNMFDLWNTFIKDVPLSLVVWTPSKSFDYQVANRWENTASQMRTYAESAYVLFKYSGTFQCGKEGLLP